MRFSRSASIALVSAGLFVMLSVPIALGRNWAGEWELVVWATGLRQPDLTLVFQYLTFLAAVRPALAICIVASLIAFWRWRRLFRQAVLPLVALAGSAPLNLLLRTAFGRLRPGVSYIPNLLPEVRHPFQRWSYPSGHAITSVVAFGALVHLLWIGWTDGKQSSLARSFQRGLILVVAVVLVGGIGFSRVYLGVHWPTDVLGGWLVGLSWLAVSIAWTSQKKHLTYSSTRRSMEVPMIRNATRNIGIAAEVVYCNSLLRRGLGLMCRRPLRRDQAFIFIEGRESITATAITMLFVFFPIAVIWLNSDKRVVDKTLARPWRLIYASERPACYYIEAHPCALDKVEIGDMLAFPDPV
jgi:undecaprenyl-diphosphatase